MSGTANATCTHAASAVPPVLLINLDDADERRTHMEAQLRRLQVPVDRIGVDLRGLSDESIRSIAASHFPNIEFDLEVLSGAEVGCWLSHLCCWRRLVEQERHHACTVLEDDIVLEDDFADAAAACMRQTLFDVVYLGTSSRNISTRKRTRAETFWMHEPIGTIFNTWGYTITREYATRFFARAPFCIDGPIDHYLSGGPRRHKPRCAVLQPCVVSEDVGLGRRSQIEPHTNRIDRWRLVERARRKILSSRLSEWYYTLYRWL